MAQQIINVGSAPNDGTGDPVRTAFQKANSNFTELYTIPGPPGPVGPPGNSGAIVDWISVRDYGAIGDGVHDDTVGIQAAIDFACAHTIPTIYLPAGNYKTTDSIYLDPPGNLRANGNVAVTGGFSLCLMGDEVAASSEGFGSSLRCHFDDRPAIIVGTGQGMMVKCVSIFAGVGSPGKYRAQYPIAGCGIAYVGGGVASRTLTEKCFVGGFYTAFKTGYFGDGLNDSNTWIKCFAVNNAIGAWIPQSQNFINSFYDCNFDAATNILCTQVSAQVFGGNWSCHSLAGTSYPASAISAFTATPYGNAFQYTFTAVLVPDQFLTFPNLCYNAFHFVTTNFGPVPCTLQNYNFGTNTATFLILQEWVEHHFGTHDITTVTDIVAEVQACVKVFAAERAIAFRGKHMFIAGIHIENDLAPSTLIVSETTFGSNDPCTLSQVFYNTDPSMVTAIPPFNMTPTDGDWARYYTARTFPFIHAKSAPVHIFDSDLQIGTLTGFSPTAIDPVIVDAGAGVFMERCHNFYANVRASAGGGGIIGWGDSAQPFYAGGVFDRYYFAGSGNLAITDTTQRIGWSNTPYLAFRPAPWSTPVINATDLTTISGALPPLNGSGPLLGSTYPLVWGGQIYRVYDFFTGARANYHFVSNHHYYSYGQNITVATIPGLAWHYKGQSAMVFVDATTMKFMRMGLQVKLNDGATDVRYIVTGIFTNLGFITVSQNPGVPTLTSGVKTSIISGTVIGQEPFAITLLP